MKGKNSFAVLLALLAVTIGMAYMLFFRSGGMEAISNAAPGGMAMPVQMATVTAEKLQDEIKAVGSLFSNESADIRPETAGRIARIAFTEGQAVAKDDLLVQIDDSVARAELAKARAALDLAKLTDARTMTLEKKGAVSQQARDEAVAGLQDAAAAYELAKVRLEKTSIRAPFAGLIGMRGVSEGDYVDSSQAITHLEMVDPVKVEFTAPERILSSVKTGLPVKVSVDAYKGEVFGGEVFAVSPEINPDTRSVHVKALIPNPGGKLRPGMFAYVALLAGQDDNALMIPEEAIMPRGADSFVFKAVDGKAEMVKVTIGARRGGKAQITGGLAAGDVIITAGQMKLQPGAPVMDAAIGNQKPETGSQKTEDGK